MFCKNCGNPIDPQAAICVKCGFAKGTGANFCHNCGQATQPGASICTSCGFALTGAAAGGEQKSKLVALLLAFFLGGFGGHDFYLGYTKNAVIKIILTVCTGFGGGVWALIDFIRLLTGSISTDANGVELKKEF
jgi:TM2 domain-containing membrane protein YozV